MNPPKCKDEDYINFLIAPPPQVSATEAARVQPQQEDAPAHDAFTRLLQRLEPDPETLCARRRPKSVWTPASWSSTTRPWTSPTPSRWSWSHGIGRVSITP